MIFDFSWVFFPPATFDYFYFFDIYKKSSLAMFFFSFFFTYFLSHTLEYLNQNHRTSSSVLLTSQVMDFGNLEYRATQVCVRRSAFLF